MSERFTIADLHLGHEATCTRFKLADGVTPLRPFANSDEMDEEIVKRWNETVRDYDKIYVLGDVVINQKNLHTLGRLRGKKRLIPGNHDIFKMEEYLKYFDDVHGYKVWVDDFIMSHIPLHPDSISKRFKANVHGHYHAHRVMTKTRAGERIDPRYLCVSVEQTNFTPISFDEVRARIKQQRDEHVG